MSTSEVKEESQSGELKDNSKEESTSPKPTISRNPTDEHQYNEDSNNESESDSDDDYIVSRKRKRCIKDDSDDSTDCDDIPKKRIKLNTKDTKSNNPSNRAPDLPLEQRNINATIKHKQTCTHCRTMTLNTCNLLSYQSTAPTSYEKDDWKLNPQKLKQAINTICNQLNMQEVLFPNIDCFASHQNYQTQSSFKWYITKENDFFSSQYDCKLFWLNIVAWSNVPFEVEILKRTMETYKRRGMRGYLCGPLWVEEAKKQWNEWYDICRKECVYETRIDTDGDSNAYFPARNGNISGLGQCPFDTVVLLYDFRDKKQRKYEKGDILMVDCGDDGKHPVIVLSFEYDTNDNEKMYPCKYELLWLTYTDEEDVCWISWESFGKIESYANVEELCDKLQEVGWKEIEKHRPQVYKHRPKKVRDI